MISTISIILVTIYLISVVISYFGIRAGLKANGFDADSVYVLVVFIPIMNLTWGALGFLDYQGKKDKDNKSLNKFFKL